MQSKLRLDHYLARELPEVSRAKLQHGIRLGLVTVNGNPQVGPIRRLSQSTSQSVWKLFLSVRNDPATS